MRAGPLAVALLLLLPTGIHALTLDVPDGPAQAWIWSSDEAGNDLGAAIHLLADLGLPHHPYQALGMASFLGTPTQAHLVGDLLGGHVEPNERYDLHLDRSVQAIEADVVADAVGTQRYGPSVLVIDTGVDSTHPDFQDGNLAANYAAERLGGLVVGVQAPDVVVDEAGHGTHVAGIVAGSGAALGDSDSLHDRYKGVYANGRIIGFQALADSQDGDDAQVDTLAALEAMDWALKQGDAYDVKVVQASWGTGGHLDPKSSVTKASLKLYLDGINVVFSGGNRGTEDDALNSFCQAPWVLCVANVDNRGSLASSSSVGTSSGSRHPYAHPDVAAPGTLITAAGSVADADTDPIGTAQNLFATEASRELYEVRTGTSMAAPHVSGAMALLLAANPDLSPDQVMDVLVETATPSTYSTNEVGAGMINVREAYNLAVQTPGNRAAFERGDQVKYGGPATGDPDYSQDPMSVGYTETPTGNEVILPPSSRLPFEVQEVLQIISNQIGITEELALYVLIGLLAFIVLIWLLRIPARRRRRQAKRERRADQRRAHKAAKAQKATKANRAAHAAGMKRADFAEIDG